MRGKKAKRYRRQARDETKGKVERQLLARQHSKGSHGRVDISNQAVNDPNSTRGVYLKLKRGQ